MIRRAAVLYSRLSGYIAACLRAVKEEYGTELLVIRVPPAPDAPFDSEQFAWIDHLYDRSELTRPQIEELVLEFEPHVTYVSGWSDRDYLKAARLLRARNRFVVGGMDAQWRGTLRQHAARLIARPLLHTAFNVIWGAGERQRQFARRLGFAGDRFWSGVYSCDWPRFARIYEDAPQPRPKAFLFVGRYANVKGISVLLDAYESYRNQVAEPWPLLCSGAGDLAAELSKREGVRDVGFTQPGELPQLMSQVSALVLPSVYEPWGVVVHEAAAAGLPVICTDACGASVHLVQHGYSGYVVASDDSVQLRDALVRLSLNSDAQWSAMSRRGHELSRQYTPSRWAETLMGGALEHVQV